MGPNKVPGSIPETPQLVMIYKNQLLKYTCKVSEHWDLTRSEIMNARNSTDKFKSFMK